MANDEVLAAAKRLDNSDASGICHDDIYGGGDMRDCWRILANAHRKYLAAKAERERIRSEPVSMAWWLSLGAEPKSGWDGYWIGPVRLWVYSVSGHQVSVGENCVWAGGQLTRGQLIDLLAGLGIETKREGGA
jgi:hypothetical protein